MVCPRKRKEKSGHGKGGKLGSAHSNIQHLTLSYNNTTTYDLCRGGAKHHRKTLRDKI